MNLVKILLTIFTLLVASERTLYTKELSLSVSENPQSIKKIHHKNSPSSLHKQRQNKNYKYIKNRNINQRCTIVCPILFGFPTNSSNYPLKNNTHSTKPNQVTTSKPASNPPLRKSLNHKNLKKDFSKDAQKRFLYYRRNHPFFNTTGRKNKSGAIYRSHHLNLRQKRILLKQLNLGNKHGEKAYEFKQISMCLCRVICVEEHTERGSTISPHEETTEAEEDESDEDSYKEGEDTLIEATVKPYSPQSYVIGGIRPFGGVDFNGFNDFGPSGELARDIPEDKKT